MSNTIGVHYFEVWGIVYKLDSPCTMKTIVETARRLTNTQGTGTIMRENIQNANVYDYVEYLEEKLKHSKAHGTALKLLNKDLESKLRKATNAPDGVWPF